MRPCADHLAQDFDGGALIGSSVISAIRNMQASPSPSRVSWIIKVSCKVKSIVVMLNMKQDPAQFPGGPADVAAAVLDQQVWLALSGGV